MHAFERAPPTHNVAVWPIIIFALTFKARNPMNRVPGADDISILYQHCILDVECNFLDGLYNLLSYNRTRIRYQPCQLTPDKAPHHSLS